MSHRKYIPTGMLENKDKEVEYEYDPLNKKDEKIEAYDDLAAGMMSGTIYLN